MASATSFTAEKILELHDAMVVDGLLDPDGNLILLSRSGAHINVGKVLNPLADSWRDAQLAEAQRKLNELRNVTLPALNLELDELRDVTLPALNAELDELHNVKLPALEAELSSNAVALETLTDVTLPALNAELDEFRDVTMPEFELKLEANKTLIDSLMDGTLPALQNDLAQANGVLNELTGVTLPALDSRLESNKTTIEQLRDGTLPGMQDAIAAHETAVSNLQNVQLPALNSALSSSQSEIDTLKDTTIPALNADLTVAQGKVNALETVTIPALDLELNTIKTVTIPAINADLTAAQSTATSAATAAAAAQATANTAKATAERVDTDLLALAGKTGRVIRSATAPTATADKNSNNLWLNTSTGQLSQWTGTAWAVITDSRLTAAATKADQAHNLAGNAQSAADAAASLATAAAGAASAADSKALTAQSQAQAAASAASSAQTTAVAAQAAADQALVNAANLWAWTSEWSSPAGITRTDTTITSDPTKTGTYDNRSVGLQYKPLPAGRIYRMVATVSNTTDVDGRIQLAAYRGNAAGDYSSSLWPTGSNVAVPAGADRQVVTVTLPALTYGAGESTLRPVMYLDYTTLVVSDVRVIDATDVLAAQATADQAVSAAATAKDAADAAQAAANNAQSTANAANSLAATADGRVTVATANPTAANAAGKPIGAIWEVRSGGTTLRRYILTAATTWTQVKIGQDFIGTNAIGSAQIADAAVGTAQIADASIVDAKIGNLNAAKITAGTLSADRIAAGSLNGNKITASTITTTQIAANAITAKEIAAGTITAAEIASNAVTTAKINAGAVTATELAVNAVVSDKIAANAVTTAKIAANAVTANEIAAGTITGDKVAAKSITADKMLIAGGMNEAWDPFYDSGPTIWSDAANNVGPGSAMSPVAALPGRAWGHLVKQRVLGSSNMSLYGVQPLGGEGLSSSRLLRVEPGEYLVSRAWFYQTGALPAGQRGYSAQIYYYDVNRQYVGNASCNDGYAQSTAEVTTDNAPTGEWFLTNTNFSHFKVPAGTHYVRVRPTIYMSTGVTPTSAEVYIGGVELYRANAASLVVKGSITGDRIQAATITGSLISANTIEGSNIKASTITAAEIASNAITAAKISAGAVVTDKIAANAVTTAKIATNAVTANEIAAGTITAAEIASNAITAAKISAGAVVTDKIAANAVTTAKIATNAVTANEIAAGTITAAEIASNAITAAKISAGAVIADKIAANAVTTAKIATNAVTANEIAAGTITATEIASNAITAVKIAAGAVTTAKIATNAVTADEIAAGTITATEIASNSITADKLVISQGANLLPDPYWFNAAAWSGSSYIATSGGSVTGSNSLLIPASTLQTGVYTTYNNVANIKAYSVNVTPGEPYRIEATAWSSSAGTTAVPRISLFARWFNAAGGAIGSAVRVATNTDTFEASEVIRLVGVVIAPDNAAYLAVGCYKEAVHNAAVRFESIAVMSMAGLMLKNANGDIVLNMTGVGDQTVSLYDQTTGDFSAGMTSTGDVVGKKIIANDELMIQGTSLSETLSFVGYGLLAQGWISLGNDITANKIRDSVGIQHVTCETKANRIYEVSIDMPFLSCRSGGGEVVMQLRQQAGNSPTLSGSTVMSTSYFGTFKENAYIKLGRQIIHVNSPREGETSFFVSMYGTSFANSSSYISVWGGTGLTVRDIGPGGYQVSNSNRGGGNWYTQPAAPPPPPQVVYDKTWSAIAFRSFDSSGAYRNSTQGNKYAMQGYYSGTYGSQMSEIYFNHADIRSNLSGSTILAAWVYVHNAHWYYNAGGTARIYMHSNTGTAPSSAHNHISLSVAKMAKGEGRWIGVPVSLGERLRGNTSHGIAFSGAGSTDREYYGYFHGLNTKIRIQYRK